MITHDHLHLSLLDSETPVYRDVIVPDSALLGDLQLIINACFGWPSTYDYEFFCQQTKARFVDDDFADGRHTQPGITAALNPLLQKNREILYYHSAARTEQVSITLDNAKSLLPEATFRMSSWKGENRPSAIGGQTFDAEAVQKELDELCIAFYYTAAELEAMNNPQAYYDDAPDMADDSETPFRFTPSDVAGQIQQLKASGELGALEKVFGNLSEDEINAMLHSMFSQLDDHMKQTYSLADCLAGLHKDSLVALMRNNCFSGYSKLNRAELEAQLQKHLTDPDFLTYRLSQITIPELELLDALCRSNMPFTDETAALHSEVLLRCGLCFLDESGQFLVVPDELRQQYELLLKDEELIQEVQFYDMLHTFCYTAVYFYGAYPVRHLLRRISESLNMVIPAEELQEVILPMQELRHDYVLLDDWIIAADLAMDAPEIRQILDELKQLHSRNADCFWPELEQMEDIIYKRRIANEEIYAIFETDFMAYHDPKQNLFQTMAVMEYWLRSGISAEAVIGLLTARYFHLPDAQTVEKMASDVRSIQLITPQWRNCGYSNIQMQIKAEEEKRKAAKTAKAAKSQPSGAKIISLQDHLDRKKNQ